MGTILRVDLGKNKMKKEKLKKKFAKSYIGGSGLAIRMLYDELSPRIDPLSSENKIIVATGPLTGTTAPCCGVYVISSKSPLTGLWGASFAGGFFGAEMKFAGYDAIIIEGRAKRPVYLLIQNEEADIRNADELWGKDVNQTTDIIQKDLPGAKVACIGQAGENLVRFAAVMSDKFRAAGRTGMGTVMGSKNVKAIAIKGNKRPAIAEPESFNDVVKEIRELIKAYPGAKTRHEYGTSAGLDVDSEVFGNTPTRYFKEGVFQNAEKLSGEHMAKTILTKRIACFMCPIACGRYVEVRSGPYAGLAGASLEYETICAFGTLCLNDNLESVAMANYLCNKWGMDTITTGNVIAFAMECYERGWITKEDGFDIEWGDHAKIIDMISKIAKREGFGDILAEGVKRVAQKIGKKAERLAMCVKGLEIPMHDPRAQRGLGLQYATDPRGAVHKPLTGYIEMYNKRIRDLRIDPKNFDRFSTKGKAELVKVMQELMSVYDSLLLCYFAYPPAVDTIEVHQVARLLSSATGFDINTKTLLKNGERIRNLQRAFNVREGISRKDDTLPERFLSQPHSKGPCKGQVVKLEPMLEKYYQLRGWSADGIPTRKRLEELELKNIANDIENLGKLA